MTDLKIRSFLTLAAEDLGAAKKLHPNFQRQTAFHLSQAVEKIIKAVLTKEGIAFAPIHQLGFLARLLPLGHVWRDRLEPLDRYTPAATALRYPTMGGGVPAAPPAQRLTADIADVEALLPEVEEWCRQD